MLKKLKIFTEFELFIARKYIKATSRGRLSFLTAFSILSIFLGVAALILVIGLMSGFQDEIQRRLLYLQPHIDIRKYPSETIIDYQDIISRIRQISEVSSVSPYIEVKCIVRKGGTWDAVILRGVTPDNREVQALSGHILSGEMDISDSGIVLSSFTAQELGMKVGDNIQLFTIVQTGAPPPFDYSVEKRKFHVTGIFSQNVSVNAAVIAYTNLKQAQEFTQANGVTGIEVWLKDPYKAPQIARKIEEEGIISFPVFAVDWTNMFKTFFSALKLEKLAMFLVMTLMVIIASFSIIATLSILILQKTREIGVLRSLGVTSNGITRIFMLVGTMIGGIGALLGGVVSIAIGMAIEKYHIIRLPAEVYMIDYLPFKLSFGNSLIIIIVTFLIVVLSTLYPSLRAARLTPVEAIRYE